jgi:hypothetical protein
VAISGIKSILKEINDRFDGSLSWTKAKSVVDEYFGRMKFFGANSINIAWNNNLKFYTSASTIPIHESDGEI